MMNAYTGVEQLRLAEVADPRPGPGQVLLRVRFAALNPADAFLALAQYPAKPPLPHILGRDCAGVVAKVGSAVTAFKAGDQVFGVADPARWGTHAEYVALPAATLALKPKDLSDVDAGSLPIAGLSRSLNALHVERVRSLI